MTKYVKYILILVVVSLVAFFVQKYFVSTLGLEDEWLKSDYNLLNLYLFGFGSSFIVQMLLLQIHKIEPKYLGFGFLALLTLKVLAFYLYMHKGLNVSKANFLEYNFIAAFFVFLFSDVFAAFKLLNDEA